MKEEDPHAEHAEDAEVYGGEEEARRNTKEESKKIAILNFFLSLCSLCRRASVRGLIRPPLSLKASRVFWHNREFTWAPALPHMSNNTA